MELKDLIDIIEAITEEKPFKLNYRLQKDGRLNDFIEGFKYPMTLHEFLIDVLESEPADFNITK